MVQTLMPENIEVDARSVETILALETIELMLILDVIDEIHWLSFAHEATVSTRHEVVSVVVCELLVEGQMHVEDVRIVCVESAVVGETFERGNQSFRKTHCSSSMRSFVRTQTKPWSQDFLVNQRVFDWSLMFPVERNVSSL